ncbi:hypothetical protein BJ166DRAFT_337496 [Pestalotiopsis sp. NC0098]|nr:hypothetical protein BJ166DRAFT_337496 [Pestalotiopsis sp. NC0098]
MTVKTAVTRAATTAVKVAVEAVEAVTPKKAKASRKKKKSLSPVEEVIDQLGMRWTEKQKQKYMKKIKVVELKRLEVPYPTDNYYMASTAAGKDQWERFSHKKPLKDKRYNQGKRREILLLDESKLQYIIPQDESVIFRDADTKDIFMVILRDFIPDDELREDMIATCRQILHYRRDDRREDPGQLVHFGYTCGGRHKPTVGLAANRRYISPKDHRELNNACQGMAGIGWNMLRSRLPQLIIDDYNECIKGIPGCPRMDMEPTKGVKNDLFAYNVGGRDLTFNEAGDLELPPPSGLSAVNYARFTHRENNGNEWFIAATLLAADSPAIGGNFYNASYGIVMEAASNTVSCFNPSGASTATSAGPTAARTSASLSRCPRAWPAPGERRSRGRRRNRDGEGRGSDARCLAASPTRMPGAMRIITLPRDVVNVFLLLEFSLLGDGWVERLINLLSML